jgi:hypothetical protein
MVGAYFSGKNRIVINKVGGGGIFNYDGGLNYSFWDDTSEIIL